MEIASDDYKSDLKLLNGHFLDYLDKNNYSEAFGSTLMKSDLLPRTTLFTLSLAKSIDTIIFILQLASSGAITHYKPIITTGNRMHATRNVRTSH